MVSAASIWLSIEADGILLEQYASSDAEQRSLSAGYLSRDSSRVWEDVSLVLKRQWILSGSPILTCYIFEATFSTMVGGVISDIYHAEDRNAPMALFSGAALFGTGLGPLISSVIVQHASWRWVYYSHAIASAVCVLVIYILFKETRGSILLSRKAKTLNKYYDRLEEAGYVGVLLSDPSTGERRVQRIRWKVKSDEERESLARMISISCYRPFRKFAVMILCPLIPEH